MKKNRTIACYLLVTSIFVSYLISLGASIGEYGFDNLKRWGYTGQQQLEKTWCVYACIAILTRFDATQCQIATHNVVAYEGSPAATDCCNKPSKQDPGYDLWQNFCQKGVRMSHITDLVQYYLPSLEPMPEALHERIRYGRDYEQDIYPCIGTMLTSACHSVIVTGAELRESFSPGQLYPDVGMYYFDPWYGNDRRMLIAPSPIEEVFCMIPVK